ncbi:cortistatin isoform X1 [Rhea pennata]|uniref:cortistatin isoform X1 n=2 Tax=Rhea pennata TaxID=8795 RepID=UPI002E26AC3E
MCGSWLSQQWSKSHAVTTFTDDFYNPEISGLLPFPRSPRHSKKFFFFVSFSEGTSVSFKACQKRQHLLFLRTQSGVTGIRNWITRRERLIMLLPGTVMLLVASLVSVLLLVWSVRATALPGEERLALQNSREQTRVRKDALLKMLADLLEDAGHEAASPDFEEEGKLEEERAALGRLAQLSQRDRKAPCKNFFWKTFTSC